MTNQRDSLTLRFEFPHGSGVRTVGIDHSTVAAFRRCIEEGKPTGAWCYLVVNDPPHIPYKLIGAFVRTETERVLFFPGAVMELEGAEAARFIGRGIDHLTADPPKENGRCASHIAMRGLPHRESRGLTYRTVPPPGYMQPWFSLLVPDLVGFDTMPERLIVQFPSLGGDDHAFGQRLMVEGGIKAVGLPPARTPEPTHVQFDLWLGRGPLRNELRVRPLAWANKPGIVEDAPTKQNVVTRRSDIDLGHQVLLTIQITRPAGRLRRLRILRPTLRRDA